MSDWFWSVRFIIGLGLFFGNNYWFDNSFWHNLKAKLVNQVQYKLGLLPEISLKGFLLSRPRVLNDSLTVNNAS